MGNKRFTTGLAILISLALTACTASPYSNGSGVTTLTSGSGTSGNGTIDTSSPTDGTVPRITTTTPVINQTTSTAPAASPAANPNAPYGVDFRWGTARECASKLGGAVDSWVAMFYFNQPGFAVGLNNSSINVPNRGYVGQPGTGCTVTGIALPCLNSMYVESQTSTTVAQGLRVFLHATDSVVAQVSLARGAHWEYLNGDPNGATVTVAQVYQAGAVVIHMDECHVVDIRPVTNSSANLSVSP